MPSLHQITRLPDHPIPVGVVPAAGLARRLAPLPCSKELFPVTWADSGPQPVCLTLLHRMRTAGVQRAFIIIRDGKWDIPSYLGPGAIADLAVAYLMVGASSDGPPYTVDQAFAFVRDSTVVFGFPDILFDPPDAMCRLRACLEAGAADVALALFPAHDSRVMDMVDVDTTGRVTDIVLKPAHTRLRDAWICAAWRPSFTAFLHEHLRPSREAPGGATMRRDGELTMGHVLRHAMRAGLRIEGMRIPDGRYLDIGTPEALRQAVCEHWGAVPTLGPHAESGTNRARKEYRR